MEDDNYKWDWMDCRLIEYNEILQEVKGQASIIPAERKLEYFRQLEQLEQQYNKFKVKYIHFHEANNRERGNLQQALEKAWDELEQSFTIVIRKYK